MGGLRGIHKSGLHLEYGGGIPLCLTQGVAAQWRWGIGMASGWRHVRIVLTINGVLLRSVEAVGFEASDTRTLLSGKNDFQIHSGSQGDGHSHRQSNDRGHAAAAAASAHIAFYDFNFQCQ